MYTYIFFKSENKTNIIQRVAEIDQSVSKSARPVIKLTFVLLIIFRSLTIFGTCCKLRLIVTWIQHSFHRFCFLIRWSIYVQTKQTKKIDHQSFIFNINDIIEAAAATKAKAIELHTNTKISEFIIIISLSIFFQISISVWPNCMKQF